MSEREEWVEVEREDELRAGMTVEVRSCRLCGDVHRFMLFGRSEFDACAEHHGCMWRCSGSCGTYFDQGTVCPLVAIQQGRLYRLVLREPEATETTTRALERTR
jgi:flavoprotein